jgi:hypothetical protein
MTKREAIEAMFSGSKVRGVNWPDENWIRWSEEQQEFLDEAGTPVILGSESNGVVFAIAKVKVETKLYGYIDKNIWVNFWAKSSIGMRGDHIERVPNLDTIAMIEVER